MTTEIKLGSKVMVPMSDAEGEMGHVFGILRKINSRWATVELSSGEEVRVGKSKVEIVEDTPRKKSKAKVQEHYTNCPHCNSEDLAKWDEGGDSSAKTFTHEWACLACDTDFGRKLRKAGRIAEDYEYMKVTAHSGRISCDNDDHIARLLRGKNLQEVIAMVSDILKTERGIVKGWYDHLNPGQQRMCLGNKLRGAWRNGEGDFSNWATTGTK